MNCKRIGLIILTIIVSMASVAVVSAGDKPALSAKISQEIFEEDVVTITLTDIGFEASSELRGSFQAVTNYFSLPYDWALTGDPVLDLRVTSAFQSLLEAFTTEEFGEDVPDRFGIVRVSLNGKQVGEERLTASENYTLEFELPREDILANGQTNTLTISWDASIACQQSITAGMAVDGASTLTFAMENQSVTPSMRNFPAPFYVPDAIAGYSTSIIVPAEPDADTLSALSSVAAGFGRQSDGQISLDMYSAEAVPASVLEDNHLVFVGKDTELVAIFEALNANTTLLTNTGKTDGAGVISLLPSAWNTQRAMLVISGADGAALRKSAGAVAADAFFSTANGSQVVVTDVSDPLENQQWQIDQTFTTLFDQAEITTNSLGMEQVHLTFHVPADISLSPEAYLELYFRHSQLINYLQSSVTVDLNGKTVGTIRFGDQTATDGLARIILPPNSVRPLKNELTLTFTLVPQDLCADERSGNYWVTVFGDSYIHLPPVFQETQLSERVYLATLRDTFFGSSSFSDLAIALDETDPASMQALVDLTLQFGALTTANQMLIDVEELDSLSVGEDEKAVVLIADSEKIANTQTLNSILPLPFETDGGLTQVASNGVSFSVDANQDYGVMQVVERGQGLRPWLLISGNTNTGVALALESLLAKLHVPAGERATVEVIDSAGEINAFLIESAAQQESDETPGEGGLMDFFSGGSNRLALVLMIPALLLTALYMFWLLRQPRKHT